MDHVPGDAPPSPGPTGAKVAELRPAIRGRRATRNPEEGGAIFRSRPTIKLQMTATWLQGRRLGNVEAVLHRRATSPTISAFGREGRQTLCLLGRPTSMGWSTAVISPPERQHGRLLRLLAQALAARRDALTSRHTAPRSAIPNPLRAGLYRASSGPRGADHDAPQRKARRRSRRWWPRTTPTRRCTCMPAAGRSIAGPSHPDGEGRPCEGPRDGRARHRFDLPALGDATMGHETHRQDRADLRRQPRHRLCLRPWPSPRRAAPVHIASRSKESLEAGARQDPRPATTCRSRFILPISRRATRSAALIDAGRTCRYPGQQCRRHPRAATSSA